MAPAEALLGLAGIADQQVDFCGTEVARIDFDQALAGAMAIALFIDVLSVPLDADVYILECPFDELAYLRGLAGGQHVVVGIVLLQDHPHAANVILRVPPITLGIEVA